MRLTKYTNSRSRQAGVTLLLSILILSSILAISFSLATILFIEIRTSSDLLKSEPAFFAAQSISEQGIFNIKRGVPAGSVSYPATIGNVTISNPVQNPLAPPVQQVQIPTTANTFDNTPVRFLLENPGSNDCTLTANPCGGYGRIKITYLVTAVTDPLYIYLCHFDPKSGSDDCSHLPSNCPTGSQCHFDVTGYSLSSSQTWDSYTRLDGLLDPNVQYELRLVNGNLGGTGSGTIFAQIESYEPNGSTRKGLPYIGQKSIEVNTTNGAVTRSIRTVVPVGGPAGTLGNSAAFIKTDSTTTGNWHGVYGSLGYKVIGAGESYPSYITLSPSGNAFYSWADPTSDSRGLYRDLTSSTRLSDTWYSNPTWNLDVNFTDGGLHQVALYTIDWDSFSRKEKIEVLDADTSNVLSTVNVSNFNGGQYQVWNISGHVIFRFTVTSGANAVMNGVFFD